MGKGVAVRRSLQRKQVPDCQVGEYLPTSLQGISLKVEGNRKHRFDNLYGLLSVRNLKWCFYKLRKKAATGVDDVTWFEYNENLDANLVKLVEKLKNKSYHCKLVRRHYIPKLNGKMRPLGIPSLEDKIVQYGVSKILEAIYDKEFHGFSYGYRPKVGALDAVSDLTKELQYGRYGWVVEADIKGFFDNMNHDWLTKMLEQKINDKSFLNLIRKWLKAGILDTDGQILNPTTGTPQGGLVSPILANMYLHYALDDWFQKRVKQGCKGRAFMVRYADDFVAGFQYQEDAQMFYTALGKRLGKFDLELEPSKTQKMKFSRFNPDIGKNFEFLGFSFHWRTNIRGIPRVVKTTMKKKFKASIANFTVWIKKNRSIKLRFLMKTLKSKLQGYWNYYGVRGNYPMLLAYWKEIFMQLWKWLNRRSQKKSFTLKGLSEMMEHFKIPKPRITETTSSRKYKFLWT